MARRGLSEASKRAAAIQAARRMIAQGDRPGYRLRPVQDGSWQVDGLPAYPWPLRAGGQPWTPCGRAIAEVLDVDADSFDVET